MKASFLFIGVLLMTSCGDGKKEAAEQMADTAAVAPPTYVIDLMAHDLPLSVDLGDRTTLGSDSAAVVWNE